MKITKQKPLATVGNNPRLEIHRAKFHPFESMKYLNVAAVKKASKALIEIGRIKGGGVESTIVAEVRRGAITKLRPLNCDGCSKTLSRTAASRRTAGPKHKKLLRETLERVRDLGYPGTKLPISFGATRAAQISIGPIIIGHGNICIVIIYPSGESCIYCLFGPGLCIGPVIFL